MLCYIIRTVFRPINRRLRSVRSSRVFLLLLFLAVFLLLACFPLRAQVVTFMPQWTPQTQFAGYYKLW